MYMKHDRESGIVDLIKTHIKQKSPYFRWYFPHKNKVSPDILGVM